MCLYAHKLWLSIPYYSHTRIYIIKIVMYLFLLMWFCSKALFSVSLLLETKNAYYAYKIILWQFTNTILNKRVFKNVSILYKKVDLLSI